MKTIRIAILFVLAVSLYSCNQDQKAEKNPSRDSIEKPTGSNEKTIPEAQTWISNFNEFRSAIAMDDLDKQKSYFYFPVNADTTQIWYAVYDRIDEENWPSSFPALFNENDFAKYYKDLFTDDFKNGLSKVDISKLSKDSEYTTPVLNESKRPFYFAVHFDQTSHTLQLTLSYSGDTDEHGQYASEGEYAVLYFFKIDNQQSLKFDKVLFAG